MNRVELKPCPFCGGNASMDKTLISKPKYQAWCKHCATIQMGVFYDTEEEALAAWNRRATSEDK